MSRLCLEDFVSYYREPNFVSEQVTVKSTLNRPKAARLGIFSIHFSCFPVEVFEQFISSSFGISSIFLVFPVFWHQWQLFKVLRDVFVLLSVFLLFCSSIFCSSSFFVICLTLLFGMNISSSSFISSKGSSLSDSISSKSLLKLKKRAPGRPPLLQKISLGGNFVRNTCALCFLLF